MQALLQRFEILVCFPCPLIANGHAGFPRTVVFEPTNALFGRIKIAFSTRAVVYNNIGLDSAHKIEHTLSAHFIKFLWHIEPKHVKRTIIQQQFTHLTFQIRSVSIKVVFFFMNRATCTCKRKIGMIPVGCRIIRAKFDALFFAGFGQFLNYIAFKRSIRNTVINLTGWPQTKTIVMFGGKYDVFHTRSFRHTYPFISIEIYGIELFVQIIILFGRHLSIARPAYFSSFERYRTPVNKHTEAGIFPLLNFCSIGGVSRCLLSVNIK